MRTLLALLAVACAVAAEPRIREDEYDVLDLASLKAGEWVEMTSVSEFAKPDGTKETQTKVERSACVKADDEFVWIEDTKDDAEHEGEKVVTVTQVRRKDRRSVKAWSGKPGGEGAVFELKPALTNKRGARPGTSATATTEKETMKVGDKDVETQKITITTVEKDGEKETKMTMTFWCVPDMPFRLRLDDASVRELMGGPATWDKTPSGPLGMLRVEMKGDNWTDTMTVSGHGTDAKPTLTVK